MIVSPGDTLTITHEVNLSLWDIFRALLFRKVLTITKPEKL